MVTGCPNAARDPWISGTEMDSCRPGSLSQGSESEANWLCAPPAASLRPHLNSGGRPVVGLCYQSPPCCKERRFLQPGQLLGLPPLKAGDSDVGLQPSCRLGVPS